MTPVQPGTVLRYAYGDRDAGEKYEVAVGDNGAMIRYRWALDGRPDHGIIGLAAASGAAAEGLIWLSKGAVIAADVVPVPDAAVAVETPGYPPPFAFRPHGSEPVTLKASFVSATFERTETTAPLTIQVGGAPVEVVGRIWQTADAGSHLLVSEDDRAPGLLRVSLDGGSVQCRLLSVA